MKRTLDERLEGAYFISRREKKGFSYWVHVPIADGWLGAQRLAVQDGAVVVSELRVFPEEQLRHRGGEWSGSVPSIPKGGISAALVRSVSVGGHAAAPVLTDWLQTMLYSKPDRGGVALDWGPEARASAARVEKDLGIEVEAPQSPSESAPNGRKPKGDRSRGFYEEVASDYIRWFRENPARKISESR